MPASRTPEGYPSRCFICGAEIAIDYSATGGDAPCPNCGNLLLESEQRADKIRGVIASKLGVAEEALANKSLQKILQGLGSDSLDTVELVMELEQEFDLNFGGEN